MIDAWPSGAIQHGPGSVVEEELLGVGQGPQDILVTLLGFILRLALLVDHLASQISKRHIGLLRARQPRKRLIVQAVDFCRMIPALVGGEPGGATVLARQLLVYVFRVKQVQALGQTGFLRALALAGA